MENSSRLRLRLKLFTQGAAWQLKDGSFQIFRAVTENVSWNIQHGSGSSYFSVFWVASQEVAEETYFMLGAIQNYTSVGQ